MHQNPCRPGAVGALMDEYERAVFALFCVVNYGLCPPREQTESLIKQCQQLDGQSDLFMEAGYDSFVFGQCHALFLISQGKIAEAERICRRLLQSRENLSRTRMTARTRCLLAKALYLQGRMGEAREALMTAVTCHIEEQLLWDRAEFSLPLQALLATAPSEARAKLDQAEAQHRSFENPLGLVKMLCLKARLFRQDQGLDEIKRLCAATSALRDCPLAARIIREWEAWVQGQPDEGRSGDGWGL